MSLYTLEVCLLDYNFVSMPGSLFASSSLCMFLLLLDPSTSMDTVWTPTLEFYSGYFADPPLLHVLTLASPCPSGVCEAHWPG